MIWVILLASAVGVVVFVERVLHYHRAHINSVEFLNGVRNVLKRDNVVEAISICDATPGPVARLVKNAILSRERGREGVREALEAIGYWSARVEATVDTSAGAGTSASRWKRMSRETSSSSDLGLRL